MRFARAVIPVVTAACVAAFFWQAVAGLRASQHAASTIQVPDHGPGMALAGPVMKGFLQDGRPYELRADLALHGREPESPVAFSAISGRMMEIGGGWTTARAPSAILDRVSGMLAVAGPVEARLASGAVLHADAAEIGPEGQVSAIGNVSIVGRGTRLTAARAQLDGGRGAASFEGSVRVVLDRGEPRGNPVR